MANGEWGATRASAFSHIFLQRTNEQANHFANRSTLPHESVYLFRPGQSDALREQQMRFQFLQRTLRDA
jgi:hypothetical protein